MTQLWAQVSIDTDTDNQEVAEKCYSRLLSVLIYQIIMHNDYLVQLSELYFQTE